MSSLIQTIIQIVISFDTTGSMYPCLTQTRRHIIQTVSRLFKDIANLEIAIIAHGDYCDKGHTYVTKILDFSNNIDEIVQFVSTVEPTNGGDSPECYELVLNEARTKLNWKAGKSKVLVIIGDDVPHSANYPGNINRIDWRNELGLLIESGINVYGVHAMPGIRRHSKPFYKEIASTTGGFYLTLDQFSEISDLIMAICYKQNDTLGNFKDRLQSEDRLDYSIEINIRRLGGEEVNEEDEEEIRPVRRSSIKETELKDFGKKGKKLIPVPSGRFQVLRIDDGVYDKNKVAIKKFIEEQGVTFQKGRGFYELTKSEDVQQYKEIILQERKSGRFYNGPQTRELLELQPQTLSGGVTEKLKPTFLKKYRVFIQSTSVNRNLIGGTRLLYEVSDWER